MFTLLASWLLSSLVILAISSLVPGFAVQSFTTALVVALVLGVINAVIKPVLLLLTLPINILTFGLFTFVINALLLLLVSSVVPGFRISGFTPALVAAIIIWITNTLVNSTLLSTRKF